MELPYHKLANQLRRQDELDALPPPSQEIKPITGGFSAHVARSERYAKSLRKTAAHYRGGRRMKSA